jgi:hypothetical protein
MRKPMLLIMSLAIIMAFSSSALPFSIKPVETDQDRRLRDFEDHGNWFLDSLAGAYIARFTQPVHEEGIQRIYGCEGDDGACQTLEKPSRFAPDAVIYGARWNDNPPFKLEKSSMSDCVGKTIKLPNYSKCWAVLFRDAAKHSSKGEFFDAKSGHVLIYRVHFGDMQFLHSMASKDKELAGDTKSKIMMWAEFTYKLAIGELDRGVELRKTGIQGMDTLFYNRGWTAQQLFTRGDATFRGPQELRDFAFGSLLHLVEDSFALSHTERDEPSGAKCGVVPEQDKPGKILKFLSYAYQDHNKHSAEDNSEALKYHLVILPSDKMQPNIVAIGMTLSGYYEQKRLWDDAKRYLDECVFDLEDPTVETGPGDAFSMD